MKFELLSKGVRKFLAHFPATVTELSWPSSAARVSIINKDTSLRTYSYLE